MSRRFVTALASASLVLAGIAVTGVTATPATASESSMFKQVNAARAAKGLGAFRWNAHLAEVAEAHARRMARQARLHHNSRLTSEVGSYRRVGENVGHGRTSSQVQKAFMKSPTHRANILRGYKQIGIGQVRDGSGRLWIVQVFRTPVASKSSAKGLTAAPKAKTVKRAKKRKTVAPKRAKPVKRVARKAPPAKKPAPAATARPAPVPSASNWSVLYSVIGVAGFFATATGQLTPPIPPGQ